MNFSVDSGLNKGSYSGFSEDQISSVFRKQSYIRASVDLGLCFIKSWCGLHTSEGMQKDFTGYATVPN